MANDTLSILDGSTFVVSDRAGDIDAGIDTPRGLLYRDTRFLSRWRLRLSGQALHVPSTDDVDYFSAQFFLAPSTGSIYQNPSLSVIRQRYVGDGLHEDVLVLNHAQQPVEITLSLEVGADFADIFEVKDALHKKGRHYRELRGNELILGYRRQDFVRETAIWASAPVERDADGLIFHVEVPPHGEWQTCLEVRPLTEERVAVKYSPHEFVRPRPNIGEDLDAWLANAPTLETDWDEFQHTYRRSLIDLAALRCHPLILPDASLPAAGLPWFMTLFGRDSLITSYQALPFVPELAKTTLRVLAARQGQRVDDFRDAEPGKILHELRFGELTYFKERPHSPYYGTADATPLFQVLLDEYERWTGDHDLIRELEPNARAGLAWIDRWGDRDGDGYVEYERRNTETGLENQCWKDSWNSILFADGSLAKLPRATCEIQGYVYDAKRRCAHLAREVWADPGLADRLECEAAELKACFNRDFWLADRQFFALALDGDKRPVDSLTSNIGHLLWSGIVDQDKARAVVEHLMGDGMFSGWGVRTMASTEGGYNPIEYHNGTVWPHDNSLIAAGLRRYGYRSEASRLAYAILEAATYFEYRLPEVFAGYARTLTRFPVEYPTACSPQAWATCTPLLLLRVLLGLEPENGALRSDPALPAEDRQVGAAAGSRPLGARRQHMTGADAIYPPIGGYGLIGDCRAAGLVSRDGSLDWLCFPRFDSPSIFGALLDAHSGGRFRIRPTGVFQSDRRYLPDTNILETTFRTASGSVAWRDLMPVSSEAEKRRALTPEHQVLREVEGLTGDVEVELVYEPRPEYGRSRPRLQDRGALGLWCEHKGAAFVLRSEIAVAPTGDGRAARGITRIRAGERKYVSFSYAAEVPHVVPPLGELARPSRALGALVARMGRPLSIPGAFSRGSRSQCAGFEVDDVHAIRRGGRRADHIAA